MILNKIKNLINNKYYNIEYKNQLIQNIETAIIFINKNKNLNFEDFEVCCSEDGEVNLDLYKKDIWLNISFGIKNRFSYVLEKNSKTISGALFVNSDLPIEIKDLL